MFTRQENKELCGENVHVIPQNLFEIFEKGEWKLNIFLVLRIKDYLSILKCTALLFVIVYIRYGTEEWRVIWGKQLLWLRFFCCGWGVKPLEQPQYTLDTNLWQLFPERMCWWPLGLIVPPGLCPLSTGGKYTEELDCKKTCVSHIIISYIILYQVKGLGWP